MFLRSMKPKALAKLKQHPGLFDAQALMAAQDLYAFDNIFTAPLHGFRDTEDYWRRASAKPQLAAVRVPALVINARNDPFIPADSLPAAHEVGQYVQLWQPDHGGHVGFAVGMPLGHLRTLPQILGRWFDQHAN
jgi:predicted alpha/beta-fold hydrolase